MLTKAFIRRLLWKQVIDTRRYRYSLFYCLNGEIEIWRCPINSPERIYPFKKPWELVGTI